MPPLHQTARRFQNLSPDAKLRGLGAMFRWAWERSRTRGLFTASGGTPPTPVAHAVRHPRADASDCAITWVGHSTFLIQVAGLNILTDPIWSRRGAPVQWAGPKRYVAPGIPFDELPSVDVVLQSHDHYDHFDDWSVRAIARAHPRAHWVAPLGVGTRLAARGVTTITQLDWWQDHTDDAFRVTCVPAQHFSGRTPWDRNSTLWGGLVLRTGALTIYFVGDTGFHSGFTDIGDRCGPFSVIFMPIGAYAPRWIMQPVHVDPDEAVRAYQALTVAHAAPLPAMVAMHWGTFVLTDEPLDEPPTRTRDAWRTAGLPSEKLWIMAPGETRVVRF